MVCKRAGGRFYPARPGGCDEPGEIAGPPHPCRAAAGHDIPPPSVTGLREWPVTAGKTESEARRARRGRKAEWTRPELARLLAGGARSNPGDSHADGPSTFS
jgi:hypothetical protein